MGQAASTLRFHAKRRLCRFFVLAWARCSAPEAPLLLISCLPVVLWFGLRKGQLARALSASALAVSTMLLVLLPWTVRNAVTLDEFQPLAPRFATMPGETVPRGIHGLGTHLALSIERSVFSLLEIERRGHPD